MPRLAWAREVVHLFSDKGKFQESFECWQGNALIGWQWRVGREGGQEFKKMMVSGILLLNRRTGITKWVG